MAVERERNQEPRVAAAETEIRGLRAELDEVKNTLAEHAHQISLGQRTPWPTLLAAGALFLTLGSAIGGLFVLSVDEFKETTRARLDKVEELVTQVREIVAQDRHWGTDIEQLTERMNKIDRTQGEVLKGLSELERHENRRLDREGPVK